MKLQVDNEGNAYIEEIEVREHFICPIHHKAHHGGSGREPLWPIV
jgi:hypothetical protein